MISGRWGDDATRSHIRRQRVQEVVCAAKLEGTGALKAFRLVSDFDAELFAQHVIEEKRRAHRNWFQYFGRSLQILKRDQRGVCCCRCHGFSVLDTEKLQHYRSASLSAADNDTDLQLDDADGASLPSRES